jgi:translation initiation factor IF-2
MHDDHGRIVEEAGPSVPVEVSGLDKVPVAGDRFYALDDLEKARQIAHAREEVRRQAALTPRRVVSIENISEMLAAGQVENLNVVVKADVMGSVEALKGQLVSLGTDEVKVQILHAGVGGVNESDVQLANASGAVVLGFRVGVEPSARLIAENRGVDIRLYDVIYELLDEVHKGLEGLLKPEEKEFIDGHVEVRQTFKISRVGTIAGCYVLDGIIARRSRVRLTRDGVIVFDGELDTLRRFKDDVPEVREGFECGIKLAKFDDIKQGDVLEIYHIEQIPRTLE